MQTSILGVALRRLEAIRPLQARPCVARSAFKAVELIAQRLPAAPFLVIRLPIPFLDRAQAIGEVSNRLFCLGVESVESPVERFEPPPRPFHRIRSIRAPSGIETLRVTTAPARVVPVPPLRTHRQAIR